MVPSRGLINVNEHLTHNRSELLYKARELVKAEKLLGAWSIDGNIHIKFRASDTMDGEETTEIKRISSADELSLYIG